MKTDLTVVACIINNDDKILLIKHSKLNMWLFPGGHIDKDETPDEAVLREAQEEVGLQVELVKDFTDKEKDEIEVLAVPFYVNLHSVGDHNHIGFFYLCRATNSDVKINNESKDFKWMMEEEIVKDPTIKEDIKKIGKMAFEKHKAIRN